MDVISAYRRSINFFVVGQKCTLRVTFGRINEPKTSHSNLHQFILKSYIYSQCLQRKQFFRYMKN